MSRPRPQIDSLVEMQMGRTLGAARRQFEAISARPEFLRDALLRYRIGQEQYRYEYAWLSWPDSIFEGEQYTEALDFLVYPTMREVRHLVHGDRL